MGSMQKVMQKLRSKGETPPTEAADAGVAPAGDDAPADAGTGAPMFVAEPRPDAEPAAGSAPLDTKKIDPALVTIHDRFSSVAEQYRSLRARLFNMNPEKRRQVIVITSSLPQEGKSVTTVNLGMALAESGETATVLVDADFRRASIARMLSLKPRPGLAELIRGEAELADVLQRTHLPNLKVVSAGGCEGKDYGALVGSAATETVFDQLRERFDYALVDTPPVNTVSDVSMLAPHCDGAMLVVEMGRTAEPTAQEAVRTLQTTGVKMLGCVLSRARKQRGHYYERYYSYYYKGD